MCDCNTDNKMGNISQELLFLFQENVAPESHLKSTMKVLTKGDLVPDEKTHLLAKENSENVDENQQDTVESYPILPQLCATLVACLGAMSAGITVGYTSPALPELRHPSMPSGVYFGDGETALFAAMLGKVAYFLF